MTEEDGDGVIPSVELPVVMYGFLNLHYLVDTEPEHANRPSWVFRSNLTKIFK